MDVFQEIVRPLSEICTGFLAASHHGVDDGCILGCIVIATEEIVLPADGYRTYAVLDEIIQTSGYCRRISALHVSHKQQVLQVQAQSVKQEVV